MFKKLWGWFRKGKREERRIERLIAKLGGEAGDEAAEDLVAIGPKIIPQLLQLFTADTCRDARFRAGMVVSELGIEAVPALAESLVMTSEPEARLFCIEALWELEDDACDAASALVHTLRDEHPEVRELAMEALWDLGPAARGAGPELIAILEEGCPRNRQLAAELLGRIDDPQAIPALQDALQVDPSASVAAAVRGALEKLAPETLGSDSMPMAA